MTDNKTCSPKVEKCLSEPFIVDPKRDPNETQWNKPEKINNYNNNEGLKIQEKEMPKGEEEIVEEGHMELGTDREVDGKGMGDFRKGEVKRNERNGEGVKRGGSMTTMTGKKRNRVVSCTINMNLESFDSCKKNLNEIEIMKEGKENSSFFCL
jgi:hypothetical protein